MLRKPKPFSKPPFPPLLLLMAFFLFLIPILLLLLSHSPSSSSELLQTACKSTLFPSTCQATLSQSSLPPNPTPPDLIRALLSSSTQNTQTALSLSQSILNSSLSNPARANAAQNCILHLTLSSLRLSSLSKDAKFTDTPSARALGSAALLYQYDCWSALKYVNGTRHVGEAMSFLNSLTRITSCALAMLAAVQRFGTNSDVSSWSPPQTERDGYWPDAADDNSDDRAIRFPDGLSTDVTVCKAGNCDYKTVQEAVNAAPDFSNNRFVIGIAGGIYEENVEVPFEKTNMVFIGDGMGKTVITGKLNAQMVGVTTFNTATVGVFGDGFMARDLTFENTAGPGSHQAVAFRCDSDLSLLYLIEFSGHQDTLYARSLRQLYINCTISGTVDFIFGNSAAVFKNCFVVVVPRQESPEKGERNAVTAHGRTDPGQATGFVFKDCVVGGSKEYMKFYEMRPMRHRVYLGRPWKQYSRTVFLDCYLGEMVQPEGWMPFRAGLGLDTLFYGEYGSLGPGANVSGRVKWSNQVPEEHLGVYSVRNFLQGGEWVLGNQ